MAPLNTDLIVDNDEKDSVEYVAFEQDTKPKPKQVDKRIFIPLYVATASLLLFTHILPPALVIVLVSMWAITFIGTPIYYLYHYDPDSLSCCRDSNTTATTATFKEQSSFVEAPGPGRTASV